MSKININRAVFFVLGGFLFGPAYGFVRGLVSKG